VAEKKLSPEVWKTVFRQELNACRHGIKSDED